MYYYKLKCVLYSPESLSLPSDLFGLFLSSTNLESSKYLENYQHSTNKSTITTRRRSSQLSTSNNKKTTVKKNIPPTPIDTTKSHVNHSLEGQVDFRFGPIELHQQNVLATSNKKKKQIEEKTIQLGYGLLHLYRDLEPVKEQDLPDTKLAKDESLNIVSDQDTVICVLAVPTYMSYKDFSNFLGAANSNITHYRYIRDYSPNKYSVLLKFRNRQSAYACYQKFNGRRFNMTEPEISHVVYIQSNTVESILIPAQSYPYLNETLKKDLILAKDKSNKAEMAELPTCPNCLERMDESVTGLLSIQCHHTSQCDCLKKWGDNHCPVCKYSQKPVLLDQPSSLSTKRLLEEQQQQHKSEEEEEEVVYECCECTSTESLWICMICGHIGCGRYQEAHAYDHYMDTNHLYALEIETQRVWDYLGDGYVHRLIQNMVDGALVELPPINQTESANSIAGTKGGNHSYQGGSSTSGASRRRENERREEQQQSEQGKLESISVDYSYMLTSQLDSQRMYYEDQLEKITRQLSDLTKQVKIVSNEINAATQEQHVLKEEGKELDLAIVEIKKEKEKSDKRATSFKDKYEAIQKNLNEEKVLTKSLIRNNDLLKKDADDKDATLKVLSDQVRDLMFFLEAKDKVKDDNASDATINK